MFRSDELVANTAYGLHDLRVLGVVLHFGPKALNMHIDQARIAGILVSPDILEQAGTTDGLAGGGRKPWRQKGTGRARQGSIRAPQWTHGGIALGPKPRDFEKSMNKKARQLAIKSALSAKFQAGAMVVVDNIELQEIKTKSFISFLNNIGAAGKTLVVMPEVRKNVVLSARNIPGVKTTVSGVISTYDILKADKFVVDKVAVEKIQEVYA